MTVGTEVPFLAEGNNDGRVTLRLAEGVLHVSVENEASGDCLLAAFQKGIAAGWVRPGLPALVDLRQFTGVTDWAAVRAVRALAPWDKPANGVIRVAYLNRHSHFGMLIQIVSAIFTRQQHQVFTDEAAALAWLQKAA